MSKSGNDGKKKDWWMEGKGQWRRRIVGKKQTRLYGLSWGYSGCNESFSLYSKWWFENVKMLGDCIRGDNATVPYRAHHGNKRRKFHLQNTSGMVSKWGKAWEESWTRTSQSHVKLNYHHEEIFYKLCFPWFVAKFKVMWSCFLKNTSWHGKFVELILICIATHVFYHSHLHYPNQARYSFVFSPSSKLFYLICPTVDSIVYKSIPSLNYHYLTVPVLFYQ